MILEQLKLLVDKESLFKMKLIFGVFLLICCGCYAEQGNSTIWGIKDGLRSYHLASAVALDNESAEDIIIFPQVNIFTISYSNSK